MPELNFKITGDDSSIKKTLANLSKIAAENNAKIAKENAKSIDGEAKSREKAVKITQDQKKVSLEIVQSVDEEAKAHDRATEAIRRKNAAFDASGRQIRPVDMSDSVAEANAYNQSRGNITTTTTTTATGPAVEYNKASNEAVAFGNAAADANKVATEATNKTAEAIKNAIKAQNSLKLELQSYKNARGSATDPAVIAEYNKKIQETQNEIAKLNNIGKRGFDELGNRIKKTIGQQEILTTRLRYFQDQLNYARVPQSFVALNKKIEETQEQLNRLANAGKKGFDDLGNKIDQANKPADKFLNTLKSIGSAILAAFSVQVIVSWLKEARELAARGEGIREAFSKLGNEKTLDLLRVATRGATSDIELMSAALRAKNFQIAPELLAKGLELAGKVSRQTGQDVTYLTDSFVNGLGRKSLLILDNLQISQVQLRAEIKKTGDFQTAVGNVVEQKLKSMGEVSMTTADKMAQFATRIANIKEMVGQKINLVLNYDSLREATKQFNEAGIEVLRLQRDISPLLTKYDQLSEKAAKNGGITKLNKIEQSLMKDIIKQVGDEIPGAITQFDKYGNAISISTKRAKEFIEQQVLLLKAINEDRIKATTDKLDDLNRRIPGVKKALDEIAKTGTFKIPETTSQGQFGGGLTTYRNATEKEKKTITDTYKRLAGDKAKYEALLASDSGQLLKKRQKEIDEFSKITPTDDGKADAAAEKAAAKLQRAKERQEAADATALSDQESLQQRMQVLKDKFERKGLTQEQAARQAIVDEFKKLAFDIEQQGNKYDAYARKYGKARANAVLGPKETVAELEPIRKAAIEDLTYRQDTAKLELNLTIQKKMYEDFENYKLIFGEAKAKERYAVEYKANTEYFDKVKGGYSKLIFKSITSSITGKNPLTGAEQDRLNSGNKSFIAPDIEAEKAKFSAVLKELSSFEQEKLVITDKFNAKRKLLGEKATEYQIKLLAESEAAEVEQLADTNAQKLGLYRHLNQEVINYSRQQLQAQVEALEYTLKNAVGMVPKLRKQFEQQLSDVKVQLSFGGGDRAYAESLKAKKKEIESAIAGVVVNADGSLSNTKLTTEQYRKQVEVLEQINGEIKLTTAQRFNNVSDQFQQISTSVNELSSALGGADTQAGYLLGTISELAGAGADAAGALASFSKRDIIGGISKTISGITKVLSIGKKVKEMNAAARKEVEDFYSSAIKGEREYQDLLKDRELQVIRNNKIALQGIRDELALRKQQMDAYSKESAEIMSKLQGQQFVESEEYKHGTWFRKAQVNKTYGSLQGKSFAELSQLLAQGKLEGDTKALVERLKELEQKGYDAEKAISDLAKETSELFTGTTSDNLTSTLLDMFRNGKTGAKDLADFFKTTMDEAALSIFKNKVLAGAMDKFYQEFDKAAQSGDELTADEYARLNGLFTSLTDDALKKFQEFQKITGSDLKGANPNDNQNTISGGVKNITADQADILSGHLAGMRLEQIETNNILRPNGKTGLELLNIAKSKLDIALKIEANTSRTASNTEALSDIRLSLKSMESKMSNSDNAKRAGGW